MSKEDLNSISGPGLFSFVWYLIAQTLTEFSNMKYRVYGILTLHYFFGRKKFN